MQPKIDKEKCIGCGTCISIAEEVFKMGDDGKAAINEGCDCTANEEKIKQAVETCPTKAISME